jgi:hypothetical protein
VLSKALYLLREVTRMPECRQGPQSCCTRVRSRAGDEDVPEPFFENRTSTHRHVFLVQSRNLYSHLKTQIKGFEEELGRQRLRLRRSVAMCQFSTVQSENPSQHNTNHNCFSQHMVGVPRRADEFARLAA